MVRTKLKVSYKSIEEVDNILLALIITSWNIETWVNLCSIRALYFNSSKLYGIIFIKRWNSNTSCNCCNTSDSSIVNKICDIISVTTKCYSSCWVGIVISMLESRWSKINLEIITRNIIDSKVFFLKLIVNLANNFISNELSVVSD